LEGLDYFFPLFKHSFPNQIYREGLDFFGEIKGFLGKLKGLNFPSILGLTNYFLFLLDPGVFKFPILSWASWAEARNPG